VPVLYQVKLIFLNEYFSGSQFENHSGDIDSKFLHHDNEIVQFKDSNPWFYYFHHSFHLVIAVCEISEESLKNVITI